MKIYGFTINKKLDRFVGRDVWVKVYQDAAPVVTSPILYIRILSREGNKITLNTLNPDIVENNRYCRDLRIIFENTVTWPQERILLIEPVEALTTEELKEINEGNTRIVY